jgi:hypothetical protein
VSNVLSEEKKQGCGANSGLGGNWLGVTNLRVTLRLGSEGSLPDLWYRRLAAAEFADFELPLLIFSANSMPPMATAAVRKLFKPSIGRRRCLFVYGPARSGGSGIYCCGAAPALPFPFLLWISHRTMGGCISIKGDFGRNPLALHCLP